MGALVTYELDEAIATITMDDGKVNALSLAMLAELNAALDRPKPTARSSCSPAERGASRPASTWACCGAGGPDAAAMVRAGFELAERVLSFPRPVVIACTGHAIAMGVFLLLSGDYRIGAAGPYKITANEVAIGLTHAARRGRDPPATADAGAASSGRSPSPSRSRRDNAVDAGFLDRVVAGRRAAAAARASRRSSPRSTATRTRRASCARARHTLSALRAAHRRRRSRRRPTAAGLDGVGAPCRERSSARRRCATASSRSRSAMLADEGVAGLHHAQGRAGSRHLDARRLRALRRQGRARPRDVLRGLPHAPAALRRLAETDDPRADLVRVRRRRSAAFVRDNPCWPR